MRHFGERMVADHGKANNELIRLASQRGTVLPAELSHGERSDFERLQKASGRDFDKAYAADMVRDHEKEAKEFQKAAKELNDPELRSFAQKTLTTIEEHLRMAREMEAEFRK